MPAISSALRRCTGRIAVAAMFLASATVLAAAPQQRSQAPGFYRMMLGDFKITALLDGTHAFPVRDVLSRPAPSPRTTDQVALSEASPGEADALLAAAHLAAPVEGSINAFVINTGSRLVLIDSGAGALYGAEGGHLLANLRAAGYRPEQVDDVLLTHLHADHVGGIVAQGGAAFPNATVHVSREDEEYWLSAANRAAAPALLHAMFDAASGSLRPYLAAHRLQTFEAGAEIVPGIRAEADAGHTPGHTIYRVQSQGQTLLAWGDTVHVAPVQFPDPSVTVRYDSDAAQAAQQRLRLYADAARLGYWIAAAHIAFPGLGHIGAEAGGFRWIPANYTTRFATPPTRAPGTMASH